MQLLDDWRLPVTGHAGVVDVEVGEDAPVQVAAGFVGGAIVECLRIVEQLDVLGDVLGRYGILLVGLLECLLCLGALDLECPVSSLDARSWQVAVDCQLEESLL